MWPCTPPAAGCRRALGVCAGDGALVACGRGCRRSARLRRRHRRPPPPRPPPPRAPRRAPPPAGLWRASASAWTRSATCPATASTRSAASPGASRSRCTSASLTAQSRPARPSASSAPATGTGEQGAGGGRPPTTLFFHHAGVRVGREMAGGWLACSAGGGSPRWLLAKLAAAPALPTAASLPVPPPPHQLARPPGPAGAASPSGSGLTRAATRAPTTATPSWCAGPARWVACGRPKELRVMGSSAAARAARPRSPSARLPHLARPPTPRPACRRCPSGFACPRTAPAGTTPTSRTARPATAAPGGSSATR